VFKDHKERKAQQVHRVQLVLKAQQVQLDQLVLKVLKVRMVLKV
jgi:hypothetical protein